MSIACSQLSPSACPGGGCTPEGNVLRVTNHIVFAVGSITGVDVIPTEPLVSRQISAPVSIRYGSLLLSERQIRPPAGLGSRSSASNAYTSFVDVATKIKFLT